MAEIMMVFVTCEGREQAETIARSVVDERLAACVNVLPAIRSCYVWEGKLTWSDEVLLIMKTTSERFDALKGRVLEQHSYDVPEILGVEVQRGLETYLEWVASGTQRVS